MVWYVVDNPRQMTAVKRKKLKMKKSAPVTLVYLLLRYTEIHHSPSRKMIAGMR